MVSQRTSEGCGGGPVGCPIEGSFHIAQVSIGVPVAPVDTPALAIKVFMALWWVPAGHRPTVAEAEERLRDLRAHGPTPRAFTFRERFPAPGAAVAPALDEDLLGCPA